MKEKRDRKTKLFLGMVIAIIAVLLIGVIYQFVLIKRLEKQINESNTASIFYVLNDKTINDIKFNG